MQPSVRPTSRVRRGWRLWRVLLAGAALVVPVLATSQEPTILPTWVTQIGASSADPNVVRPNDGKGPLVQIDTHGNTIVASEIFNGAASHVLVTKYDPTGTLLWQTEHAVPGGSTARLRELALGADGAPVVVGACFVVSLDPSGAQRWVKTLQCSNPRTSIAVHTDGSVALGDVERDSYLVTSLDAAGQVRWQRRSLDAPTNYGTAEVLVAIDPEGRIVAAGTVTSGGAPELLVTTYAPDGTVLGAHRLAGTPIDRLNALMLASGGQPLVVINPADSVLPPVRRNHCGVARFATAGPLLWYTTYPALDNDYCVPEAVTIDSADGVVVAGTRKSYWSGTTSRILFKISGDGRLLWETSPPSLPPTVRSMVTDSQNNILVAGQPEGGSVEAASLAKLSPQGSALWAKRFGDCTDVAVGPNGAVAGATVVLGPINQDLSVQVFGSDGVALWAGQEAPASSADVADGQQPLAVDRWGRSVVAGTTLAGGTADGLVTVLDASGDIVWSRTYDSPYHGHDKPFGVAVDSTGAVLVTGESQRACFPIPWQWNHGPAFLQAFDQFGAPLWSAPSVSMRAPVPIPALPWGFWVIGQVEPSGSSAYHVQRWSGAGTLMCDEKAVDLSLWKSIAVADLQDGLVVPLRGGKTVRLDSQCKPSWIASTGLDAYSMPEATALGPDGSVAIVGGPSSTGIPFVQQLDPRTGSGWVRTESCSTVGIGGCRSLASFRAVAFSPTGELVASGWMRNDRDGMDVMTVSYAPDGTRRWARHLPVGFEWYSWWYSLNATPRTIAVTVDAHGSVAVAVTAPADDGTKHLVIAGYASDGTERWTTRWPEPTPGGQVVLAAAALDPTGGVIVLGSSQAGLDPQITVLRFPVYSTGRVRRHLAR